MPSSTGCQSITKPVRQAGGQAGSLKDSNSWANFYSKDSNSWANFYSKDSNSWANFYSKDSNSWANFYSRSSMTSQLVLVIYALHNLSCVTWEPHQQHLLAWQWSAPLHHPPLGSFLQLSAPYA
jgi:hypothetical protein